jgi:UDP-GlcNAc:undecaprenyl-phosphate GlcNAc-1-phosphate transferase
VLAVLYLYRFQGFSRAVFVFDAVLLALMLLGSRALLGAVDDYLQRTRSRGRQTLILGAGRAGALAVQELLQNPQLGLVPGAFLDDDPAKHGQRIGGVRVLGSIASLTEHLDHNPGEFASVVIAVSGLPHDMVATVLAECDARNIPVQRMRVSLEDAEWRHRGPGIVKFPGRGRQ